MLQKFQKIAPEIIVAYAICIKSIHLSIVSKKSKVGLDGQGII